MAKGTVRLHCVDRWEHRKDRAVRSPEIHRLDARHSQQELREAGNAGFKGTTYTFTNVDLSKLPPGSVGTYYLVNLPGNGAEGMTATASN